MKDWLKNQFKTKVVGQKVMKNDEVDLQFFHFLPRKTKLLDHNQRLLVKIAYQTFEDAVVRLSDQTIKCISIRSGRCRCIFSLDGDPVECKSIRRILNVGRQQFRPVVVGSEIKC
ncbi:MAG: hypothetical protein EZS28_013831 [Streblomastix strix]|uniref:Uncharacterized protein n=1 Tax=Streblomastix strix TaxID=222440 RepID=A0A5J4W7U4_9EUKA|nr:MAG: hypothetical protein EZS28_013831 [Streblomastix strix]